MELGKIDMFTLDYDNSFKGVQTCQKNFKLYILHLGSLLFVNFISIKLQHPGTSPGGPAAKTRSFHRRGRV